MRVSIIGHGFVGKALENALNHDLEVQIIDPIYQNKVSDVGDFCPKFIFICVPTPMGDDGNQDLRVLEDVIENINKLDINSEIIIKSTVLPNHISRINNVLPNVVYNPEFLTEKNAFEDFIKSDFIVLGGNDENLSLVSSFYSKYTKCESKNYILTDLISASLIKYAINCFLATKVIFFNELNTLFKESGTNESWQNFIHALSLDKRIGKSHMQVPGPDGRYGYGGACFPKDSKALYEYSLIKGVPFSILKKAIDINDNIRSSYESPNRRELDQNINFLTKE